MTSANSLLLILRRLDEIEPSSTEMPKAHGGELYRGDKLTAVGVPGTPTATLAWIVPYGSWYGPHPGGADRVDMVEGATLNLPVTPWRPLSGLLMPLRHRW
jgi:hypothetical protein